MKKKRQQRSRKNRSRPAHYRKVLERLRSLRIARLLFLHYQGEAHDRFGPDAAGAFRVEFLRVPEMDLEGQVDVLIRWTPQLCPKAVPFMERWEVDRR